jgi:hypothetical protein
LYFINRDDEDYKDLHIFRKALAWNIPLGDGRFLPIPRPPGWSWIFGMLPELALEMALEDDPTTWKKLKESFAVNFDIPLVVSAVSPLIEVYSNIGWNGMPIEGIYDRMNYPAYLIRDERTSKLATLIGDIFKNEDGLSPKQIDYLVKAYTGKVGEFFWKALDTAKRIAKSPTDITEYPIIKSLIIDTAYSSQQINDFYDYGEELDRRKNEYKETGKYPSIAHLPASQQRKVFERLEEIRKKYNQIKKEFTEARKKIQEIQQSDADENVKKQKERQIRFSMNRKARTFNDAYAQFKKSNNIK